MKILRVLMTGICSIQMSCIEHQEAAIDPKSPLSPADAESLMVKISESGGEASLHKDGTWSFSLVDSPERCLPISNEIPAIKTFFLTTFDRELSAAQFNLIKLRPETREFRILYGSLSPDALGMLSKRFPRLESLIFWSPSGSDILRLPDLRYLKTFISDYDNLITVEEAKRIRDQKSLTSVDIERAESKDVFDILNDLPMIEELRVSVTLKDGKEVEYEL